MKLQKTVIVFSLGICFCLVNSATGFSEETRSEKANTIIQAFKEGTVKGTIGNYYESTDAEASDSSFSWSTTYLTVKYETLSWNRLKLGSAFFIHGEIHSDHDNNTTDPFDTDVEEAITLPELYLNYGFGQDSSLTAGRWAHGKVSHIDDCQSEGAYVRIKEIDNLELIVGFMTRFAEIDYDDGEDFGRINASQDLGTEGTYGSGSNDYLLFTEAKWQAMDILKLNPYIMSQDDYAKVYGLDVNVKTEAEDMGLIYGGRINYYHVNAQITDRDDADNFAIVPFVKKGGVRFDLGYAHFNDGANGNALNKPAWLRDYLLLVDQLRTYGNAGSDVIFGKVKYTLDKFWTHVVIQDTAYNTTAARGDGSQEYELQFGYNFTKNMDLNIRLFDVDFDSVDNQDYHKIETRLRFKF